MESQIISENTNKTATIPNSTPFSNSSIFNRIKLIRLYSILSMMSSVTRKIKNKVNAFINNNHNNFINNKNKNFLLPVIFILVIIIILGAFLYFGRSGTNLIENRDEKPAPSVAKETKTLNKEIEFPIRDNKGNVVSKLKYKIETAELYDSIIVKGQRARAVQGRTFLVLNIKLINQYTQAIEIKTSDYVRLSVNNKKEFLAPDIHNDPVSVQPISTKYTKIGFAINETDKNITLRVGEITGDKQIIKINF